MEHGKHQKKRIRVLVKAFPQSSTKHEETVCCAGITEDTQKLLRLYPIRYRRLPECDRFNRYDLVEMTISKASDHRPESYKVDEGSIRLVESGRQLSGESKTRLWLPHIAPSLNALMDENRKTGRSLGIIKPDTGGVRFIIKEAGRDSAQDQKISDLLYQQASLLEDPLRPLEKPQYSFSYKYTSGGHPHQHQIHDWEVQASYINYRKRYKTDKQAIEMMRQQYQDIIPDDNLHFVMGTMKAHPQTFIVIGLLRSTLDPGELNKQKALF